MANDWYPLAVAMSLLIPDVASSLLGLRVRPTRRPTSLQEGIHCFGRTGPVLGMVALIASGLMEAPTLAGGWLAVCAGSVAVGIFWANERRRAVQGRRHHTGDRQRLRSFVVLMADYWPRSKLGKSLVALRIVLNATTEELVLRLILIDGLASMGLGLTGCLLSILLSVILHLYQGQSRTLFHVAFSGCAVCLFISVGLIGSVWFHLVYNLVVRSMEDRRHLFALFWGRRRAAHSQEAAGR